MPDSSYRLFAAYKQNISTKYVNGIVYISKNGTLDSGSLLKTNDCYLGHGFGQLRGIKRNYFLYSQASEYCQEFQTISKTDANGSPQWQLGYIDLLGTPEAIRGDSFGIFKGNSFVIFNSSGDSLWSITGKNYSQIKQIQGGYYVARESNHWVLMDKFLNEISRKSDSATGIAGSVLSYERLNNGKFAVLVREKCIYDQVLLNSWCTYSLITLSSSFKFEKRDSVSYSINSKSGSGVKELTDGGILVVVPESRYDIKLVKFRNDAVEYSFVVNNTATNTAFGIWGDEFHAYELIRTNDDGVLLVIDKENGPYNHSTMLMKFDSVGNFYWPFATGQKETPTIIHSVYPNPVYDYLSVKVNEPGIYAITITNMNGQVTYEAIFNEGTNIPTAKWAKGIYFYQLRRDGKVSGGRFMKL